jgi:hypothetical protein
MNWRKTATHNSRFYASGSDVMRHSSAVHIPAAVRARLASLRRYM